MQPDVSTFGCFLEQRTLTGQRELEATSGFAGSVSLGYSPWNKARIQGTVTWAPTEFEFRNDTPVERSASTRRTSRTCRAGCSAWRSCAFSRTTRAAPDSRRNAPLDPTGDPATPCHPTIQPISAVRRGPPSARPTETFNGIHRSPKGSVAPPATCMDVVNDALSLL